MDLNLEDLLAVSGMPGLYTVVTNRHNGLVVEDIDTGERKFCSMRKHQFTPMATVAIYTTEEAMAIEDLFRRMNQFSEVEEVPAHKEDTEELKEFFAEVLPEYDRERVHIGDIKKVIKWYHFLDERGFFDEGSDEEE